MSRSHGSHRLGPKPWWTSHHHNHPTQGKQRQTLPARQMSSPIVSLDALQISCLTHINGSGPLTRASSAWPTSADVQALLLPHGVARTSSGRLITATLTDGVEVARAGHGCCNRRGEDVTRLRAPDEAEDAHDFGGEPIDSAPVHPLNKGEVAKGFPCVNPSFSHLGTIDIA